jgi:Tol biopolymer transport system component
MRPSQKFFANPAFDKYLVGGLGCGLIVLCVILSSFFIIWQNPPRQVPNPTTPFGQGDLTAVAPGASPTALFPLETPAGSGTGDPTLAPPASDPAATLPPGSILASPAPAAQYDDSPPTGRIVYTCFVEQIDQICLMNADGSGRRQLTDFAGTAFYASISPEGDQIYFSSRDSGSFEIYSMNMRGRELRRLTRGIGSVYAPERSPTNDRILFANETGGLEQIWTMRADGNNPHPLGDGISGIDPTWSPDGSMIAFASARTGQRQLYVMNRDGSGIRQVTNLPDMGGRSTWSPDGTKLAFYAGPEGNHNIYVINVDGTGLVQLTDGGDNLGPSWSPDGDWIAFTSFRDGNNEIYIMHPDGTDLRRLTTRPTSDWQPRWGP